MKRNQSLKMNHCIIINCWNFSNCSTLVEYSNIIFKNLAFFCHFFDKNSKFTMKYDVVFWKMSEGCLDYFHENYKFKNQIFNNFEIRICALEKLMMQFDSVLKIFDSVLKTWDKQMTIFRKNWKSSKILKIFSKIKLVKIPISGYKVKYQLFKKIFFSSF